MDKYVIMIILFHYNRKIIILQLHANAKKVVTLSIKKAGTIFDLINVFSLVGKRVHNMQSIFVIGEGISKVKNCRYMEHKVEKFLNYIGKYYTEEWEKTSTEL